MDEKGLGHRLQLARRRAGLTQQALCQKANLSYSTLAKIERGAIKAPSIFTIQSIAAALDQPLDFILAPSDTADKPRAVSKSGVKFVYFDINGCLIHFFHRAFVRLARETGLPVDLIETAYWHYNDAACLGTMTMNDFNKALGRRLGLDSLDWQAYYLDAVEPVPGMDETVRWAAEHYRVGLLTNIMPGFVRSLIDRHLIPDIAYDAVVDSSEVGAIKPEARMFSIALERAGVAASEVLLIDDSRQNLMAAEQLGWHVLWSDDYHPDESIGRIRHALEVDQDQCPAAPTPTGLNDGQPHLTVQSLRRS